MRSYTLTLLSRLNTTTELPVVESEIVQWSNQRLETRGENLTIRHFQDKKIRTSRPILELIESLQPDTVDWSNVMTGDTLSYQQCMDNAKYAVTMARKIGETENTSIEDEPTHNQSQENLYYYSKQN